MAENQRLPANYSRRIRTAAGVLGVGGLCAIFIFQRINWSGYIFNEPLSSMHAYVVNRTVRFLLNDIFAILLVLAVFGNRSYVILAIWLQVVGFVLILLPYIILKFNYPSYNGPLISFLHRLVLNPILIYLLIFYLWHRERNATPAKK